MTKLEDALFNEGPDKKQQEINELREQLQQLQKQLSQNNNQSALIERLEKKLNDMEEEKERLEEELENNKQSNYEPPVFTPPTPSYQEPSKEEKINDLYRYARNALDEDREDTLIEQWRELKNLGEDNYELDALELEYESMYGEYDKAINIAKKYSSNSIKNSSHQPRIASKPFPPEYFLQMRTQNEIQRNNERGEKPSASYRSIDHFISAARSFYGNKSEKSYLLNAAGNFALAVGNIDKAKVLFTQAVSANPHQTTARNNLGLAKYFEAVADFESRKERTYRGRIKETDVKWPKKTCDEALAELRNAYHSASYEIKEAINDNMRCVEEFKDKMDDSVGYVAVDYDVYLTKPELMYQRPNMFFQRDD